MDNLYRSEEEFKVLVHKVLNEKYLLGLRTNVKLNLKNLMFEPDLLDGESETIIEIKKTIKSIDRGVFATSITNQIMSYSSSFQNLKFFLIFFEKINNSDRKYLESYFNRKLGERLRKNVTVYDREDIIGFAKELNIIGDESVKNDLPFILSAYKNIITFCFNESIIDFTDIKMLLKNNFSIERLGSLERVNFHSKLEELKADYFYLTENEKKAFNKSINTFLTDLLEVKSAEKSDSEGFIEDSSENSKINKTQNNIIHKQNGFSISESDQSVIGVDELASVMAVLLTRLKENDKGKMIGIFGHWGRGKTFLMNEIWKKLDDKQNPIFYRIDFHAWKYQDTTASWAYLYETFSEKFLETNKKTEVGKLIEKTDKRIRLNLKRIGLLPIAWSVITIIIAVSYGYFGQVLKSISHFLLFFGIITTSVISLFYIAKKTIAEQAKDLFKKYFTNVSFSRLLGVQSEIQSELKILIDFWLTPDKKKSKPCKILLFVDDIDRCSEDKIMIIIDALRVMLEDDEISKKVIVVAAIDERVLRRAIALKYHELLDKDFKLEKNEKIKITDNITKEYMDKLFLSGINLGLLSDENRKDILKKYINNRVYTLPKDKQKTVVNPIGKSQSQTDNDNSSRKSSQPSFPVIDESLTPKEDVVTVDGENYDLLEDEEKCLIKLMEIYNEATPRQIRIFYYRYLLARNLLVKQEETGVIITNKLISQFNSLAYFLLNYTIANSIDLLRDNKRFLNEEKLKGKTQSQINLLGSNEVKDIDELIEIHSILDIVMTY